MSRKIITSLSLFFMGVGIGSISHKIKPLMTKTKIEKHEEEFVETKPVKIIKKRNTAIIQNQFESSYHGKIDIENIIDTSKLMKNHSISLDLGYYNMSFFTGLGYGYKRVVMHLLVGYDFRRKYTDVGFMLSYCMVRF